ncbi:class D sortase [Candidatus Parcubacteria bacterium]|nr:class D sortase [Candidatus Parcubacteria bacterium]
MWRKFEKPRVNVRLILALWSATFALMLIIFLGFTSLMKLPGSSAGASDEPTLIARAPSNGLGVSPSSAIVAGTGTIKIGKIALEAPIVFSLSADLKDLARDLTQGVVHYPGSAMPGGVGNVFIAGHSSGQVWDPNPYKRVFAKLGQLKRGDNIVIVSTGTTYTYRVRSVMVLRPDEIRIFQPSTSPMLTLSTCWPIGSATNRFVVEADLVS